MNTRLTRSIVKKLIQDGDRVFLASTKEYAPQTIDHQQCWPKIVAAIERNNERGAIYSTLRMLCGSNKDYVAYLIGQIKVLRCPELEARFGHACVG